MPQEKNISILVVEDDDAVRELICEILNEDGHHVEAAGNGRKGLELFTSKNFDMVFTDLIMPEMSGWQLAVEIKTISSTTPVALITAWTLNMEAAELRSKGIDFIVFKPFRDEQLQKLVQDSMAIKEKYATPRMTDLVPDEGEIAIEDLIANEGVIITITHAGLIKRTNVSSYCAQRRGGKGVIGMVTREADAEEDRDFIEHLFTAGTHDHLMFFTNTGRVYAERVHEVPDMARAAKGRSIANLLELKQGETIAALIRIEAKAGPNKEDTTWQQSGCLFFATQQGTVKKTPLEDFANVRKDGIIAIGIDSDDTLIEVKLTSGQDQVVLITRDGMSIRFSEDDVRSVGRPAAGVRGISLDQGDAVVALAVVVRDATLLVAGQNGIGKRTPFDMMLPDGTVEPVYRLQSRGGKGIITMKANERTGAVVGALTVRDADEIMLITAGGQMVRTFVKDIREAGRNTQGVKLINLAEGDKLQAIAPVISEQQENAAVGE